jgi:putative DNA primase/helicase
MSGLCEFPGAETIAAALGGRKAGGAWMARCPAYDDRKPSLSIRDGDDGRVLVCCHAGCEQERVIAALRSRGLWEEIRGDIPIARYIFNDPSKRRRSRGSKPRDGRFSIWPEKRGSAL